MLFFRKKKIEGSVKTSLLFEPRMIRTVMNKTGWEAYEAYCNMLEMKRIFDNPSFQEIRDSQLWRKYKILQAESLKDHGSYLTTHEEDYPERDHFYNLFYTDKQKASLEAFRSGHLTLRQLTDLLQVKLPESLREYAELDISNKIATYMYLSFSVDNAVFLCPSKKYRKKELVSGKNLLCIIGYNSYSEEFADTGIPFIGCSFLGSYIIDMSAAWKHRFPARTIGISGSIGKTTTTEMINLVTSLNMNTYKITGNRNTTWQIAQFAYRLSQKNEAYVQECSGSYLTQLELSSRVLCPDIYVLTNIGHGHIGNFEGRQELLLYEKLSLDRHASDNGIGVINWDDPLLRTLTYNHRIVSFAIEDKNADFYSSGILEKDGIITFDIIEKGYGSTPVTLNVIGRHNIYNALAAFAVGVQLGIDRAKIANALSQFKTTGVRQNYTSFAGRRLYLDCYSATVESMETGMLSLGNFTVPAGGRKIACLGDIPSLEDTEAGHRAVGNMVCRVRTADEVIFYGEDMKFAYEEALAGGVTCRHMTDRLDLERYISEETSDKDLVMFKASHKAAFQWVLDDLFGTNFYSHDELTKYDSQISDGSFKFKCTEEYGASLLKYTGSEAAGVTIPAGFRELSVRLIDNSAFSDSDISTLIIPCPVSGISEEAFNNCRSLKDVTFPSTLKYVGTRSFKNCCSLEEIDLSGGCLTIDSQAFTGCGNLKRIVLGSDLKTIREDSFDQDCAAEFICPAGSYAESWVRDHGFKFTE